jgi:hypothetical protein
MTDNIMGGHEVHYSSGSVRDTTLFATFSTIY